MSPPRLLLGAALAVALSACAPPPPDTPVDPLVALQRDLQGAYRLEHFHLEVAPEPIIGALIADAEGAAVFDIDATHVRRRDSEPPLAIPYEVQSAAGDRVDLRLTYQGRNYSISALVTSDGVRFRSLTKPWEGEGKLLRL